MNRIALAIIVVLSTQGVGCGCGGGGNGDSGVAGSAQAAPTGFTATAFGSARINLSWSYGSETDGFKIQRGTDGATFSDIATVGKTVRDFADMRLDSATKFYYRVRGYSAAGDGAQSAVASVTTGAMAWSSPTLGGTAPSPRMEHAAAYGQQRMIVCGGYNGSTRFADALSLAGAWSDLGVMPGLGAQRAGHSAIYDFTNNRIVVFGGGDGDGGPTATVFQLSLNDSSWSTVATSGGTSALARKYHSAIYDSANQRMIVYGGRDPNNGKLNDVWQLTLPAPAVTHVWTALGSASARELHTAVYDAANQRMIVFGGSFSNTDGTGYIAYNDVYAVSLPASGAIAWTPLYPTSPPGARDGAAAIYDSANQRMILFGGKTSINTFSNEVWELSLPVGGSPAWKPLSPSGTLPAARMRHSAVYDSVNQRLVLFGGASAGTYYNDTWFLGL